MTQFEWRGRERKREILRGGREGTPLSFSPWDKTCLVTSPHKICIKSLIIMSRQILMARRQEEFLASLGDSLHPSFVRDRNWKGKREARKSAEWNAANKWIRLGCKKRQKCIKVPLCYEDITWYKICNGACNILHEIIRQIYHTWFYSPVHILWPDYKVHRFVFLDLSSAVSIKLRYDADQRSDGGDLLWLEGGTGGKSVQVRSVQFEVKWHCKCR